MARPSPTLLLSITAVALAAAIVYVRTLPPVTLDEPAPAAPAAPAFGGVPSGRFDEEELLAELALPEPQPAAPAPAQDDVIKQDQCDESAGLPDIEEARRQLVRDSGALAGTFGAPRTGLVALRQKLPVMPGAMAVSPLGDQLEVYGLPMNVVAFETERRPDQVLEYYAKHFEERGWPWTGLADTGKVIPYPAISATDPAEQIQLSVMVMPHERGDGSTVFLSLADMLAGAENARKEELADLPLYPETRPLAVRSLDEETRSLSVSFTTQDPPETVAAYYRGALAQLGSREVPSELGADEELQTLRFSGPARQWSLTISGQGQETAVTALSSLEEVLP